MFSARYVTCKRFVLDRIEETESEGSQNRQIVKYGQESHNQELLCWRGPAEI
jgi:hypothetical protein